MTKEINKCGLCEHTRVTNWKALAGVEGKGREKRGRLCFFLPFHHCAGLCAHRGHWGQVDCRDVPKLEPAENVGLMGSISNIVKYQNLS